MNWLIPILLVLVVAVLIAAIHLVAMRLMARSADPAQAPKQPIDGGTDT